MSNKPVIVFEGIEGSGKSYHLDNVSRYLKKKGFGNIYHLKGGILRYFEDVPEAKSKWNGECFVFDQRVALNYKLLPGVHRLCHACGSALTPQQRYDSNYVHGIQCSQCNERYSDKDRARFAERQRQIHERANQHLENSNNPE